ncbi:MAG: DUF1223 domain-containing protein [Vicinamibacterales bacterium]
MKFTAAAVVAALVLSGGAMIARHSSAPFDSGSQSPRVPVLAELFTSEGCSSCPPADDLLRHLLEKQPIDGVEVIAISEHVDYWNRLGWRDPFSSAQFSERQSEYARAFASGQIYTPQLVVAGHIDAIGNDADAVRRALLDAAGDARATVSVSASGAAGGQASVRVVVSQLPAQAASSTIGVVVAVVEDGLVTDVPRGENARKRLRHDAVARVLSPIGTLLPSSSGGEFNRLIDLAGAGASHQLRVVAFLQDRKTLAVVGVGSTVMVDPR